MTREEEEKEEIQKYKKTIAKIVKRKPFSEMCPFEAVFRDLKRLVNSLTSVIQDIYFIFSVVYFFQKNFFLLFLRSIRYIALVQLSGNLPNI